MLKVNLTESKSDWRKKLAAAFVSVSFMGLVLLAVPAISSYWAEPRPAQIEETETIVAATERLEHRLPKLSDWMKDFRLSLQHNEFDVIVRKTWRSSDLVEQSESTLVFTNKFFDADPITQEQALLAVLVSLHSQIETDSEVAVSAD